MPHPSAVLDLVLCLSSIRRVVNYHLIQLLMDFESTHPPPHELVTQHPGMKHVRRFPQRLQACEPIS